MTKDKKPYTYKAVIRLEVESTHPSVIDGFAHYQKALGYHEHYYDGKIEVVHVKKAIVEQKEKL